MADEDELAAQAAALARQQALLAGHLPEAADAEHDDAALAEAEAEGGVAPAGGELPAGPPEGPGGQLPADGAGAVGVVGIQGEPLPGQPRQPAGIARGRHVRAGVRVPGAGAGLAPPGPEPAAEAGIDAVLGWATRMCQNNMPMTPDQLTKIIHLVNDIEVHEDDVRRMALQVQYQGFDPLRTAAAMMAAKAEKGLTTAQFMNDVVLICVIFLTRGTNIPSMVKRMSDDGKARVLEVEQRYAIKKGQRPPDEITVARVALTFHRVTIIAANCLGEMLPFPLSQMRAEVPEYPAAMMTQAFAAAIPKGKPYEAELLMAHCLFLYHFSKVINPDLRNKGDAAVKESFMPAVKAAVSKRDASRTMDNVALLIAMDVLVAPQGQQAAPAPAVRAAADKFRQLFGNLAIE